MDGAAIKEIAERLQIPHVVNGFIVHPNNWIANDPASLVKPGPTAKALPVATLGAVRDYINANKDALDVTKLAVHVVSPSAVSVLGPLDIRARVRETFIEAKCADLVEGWLGKFWPLEEFLIGLQVRFADGDDRKKVLALLSNVKHEQVKSALDDGMTQVVQARSGIALVTDVAVPNPVSLVAFRTFRDVTQASALYVLRLNSGKAGGLPEAGLFEADGGAWRLTATGRVSDWLTAELPNVSVLA